MMKKKEEEGDAAGVTTKNESAESLLAHELNKLTFRERESINEEIHGIGVDTGAATDNVTPETLSEYFRGLQAELDRLCSTDGGVGGTAFAFQRSQNLYCGGSGGNQGTYLNSEDLRIMFLRCERFDVKKAAVRLCHFADLIYYLYGDTGLERKAKLSDISEDELEIMKSGRCQNLRARDRAGRRIYVHFYSEPWSYLPMKTRLRIVTYYAMSMLSDPSSQRRGIVLLFWMHNFQIKVDRFISAGTVHGRLERSLPIRVGAAHYFLPSSDSYEQKGTFAVAKIISRVTHQFKPHTRLHWGM